jgi:hypothetical protein
MEDQRRGIVERAFISSVTFVQDLPSKCWFKNTSSSLARGSSNEPTIDGRKNF